MAKFTRAAIMQTFLELLKKKSLDKITVKDVIEATGVNRNTFYYYFDNIYDLLDAAFTEEFESFIRETPEDCTFYEEYRRFARFMMENREVVFHLYHSDNQDILFRYLENAAKSLIDRFVRQAAEGIGLSDAGLSYITCFYSWAIIGNTRHWIEQGITTFDDDVIRTFSRSYEATIDIMIADYIESHPEACPRHPQP